MQANGARTEFKKWHLGLVVAGAVLLGTLIAGTSPAVAHVSYTVQPGDTLSEIAVRFDVSAADIMVDNGLVDPNRIKVGQTLQIPTSHSTPSSPSPQTPYTVVAGDTLSRIGAKLSVPWADIAEANGLAAPYRIRVGQVLAVPGGSGRYPNLPQRILDDPNRLALIPSFEKWSAHYGISRTLVMAVAYQETGWQNSLTSSAGAMGVGQIMPATATWLASDIIKDDSLNPWNADHNIRMMSAYLGWLVRRLGTEELATAAYYQGQGSIEAGKYYEETRRYVANVNAHRGMFTRR